MGQNFQNLKVEAERSSQRFVSTYSATQSQNPKAYYPSRPIFVSSPIAKMYFTSAVYQMYSSFVNSTFVHMDIESSEEAKWRITCSETRQLSTSCSQPPHLGRHDSLYSSYKIRSSRGSVDE